MGLLVDGEWRDTWYRPDSEGRFVRPETVFRGAVGGDDHPAVAGRYHLYVSWACPWAHRTLIGRALYGLADVLGFTSVSPFMTDQGWHFGGADGSPVEPLFGASHLRDIYRRADARCTGRVTVPVLWDKHAGTIVNNESKEVLRMPSATAGASSTSRTSGDSFATSTKPRAWPRLAGWTRSPSTTTAPTRASTPLGSSPSGRTSTSRCLTAGGDPPGLRSLRACSASRSRAERHPNPRRFIRAYSVDRAIPRRAPPCGCPGCFRAR